jgi:PAS domain-containing protein
VPQGILLIGADDRVRMMNRRAIALLGLPPALCQPGTETAALNRWQIENGTYASDPAALAHAWGLEEDPAGDALFERHMPDGRVLEVHSVRLAAGGGVRTYTDITERKRAEAALAAALAAARDAAVSGPRSAAAHAAPPRAPASHPPAPPR